jgi:hypothetical protein
MDCELWEGAIVWHLPGNDYLDARNMRDFPQNQEVASRLAWLLLSARFSALAVPVESTKMLLVCECSMTLGVGVCRPSSSG